MAIIYSYPAIEEISGGDLVLVSDSSKKNATKSATVDQLSAYIASSSTGLVSTSVTLTSAQLLSLNGGGGNIELVSAPGAGKTIDPISVVAFLDFNTTAYNFSTSLYIKFTSQSTTSPVNSKYRVLPSPYLNASEDNYSNAVKSTYGTNDLIINEPLVLYADNNQTVTQGDSPITINILYRVVDLS